MIYCVTNCKKSLVVDNEGMIVPGQFCIACLVEHLR